jgi:transcriptional regulator with XRE-family HTH domain
VAILILTLWGIILEKIIREIRAAARMSQVAFARAIGKSLQTVRNYEHGHHPPEEVIEVLKSLAVKCGRADLGMALGEWGVKRVIHPGETLISSAMPATPLDQNARYRSMLDEVLNSGEEDASQAVKQNLEVFVSTVRMRRKNKERKPRTGTL